MTQTDADCQNLFTACQNLAGCKMQTGLFAAHCVCCHPSCQGYIAPKQAFVAKSCLAHLISLCRVCLLKYRLYFLSSKREAVFFRFCRKLSVSMLCQRVQLLTASPKKASTFSVVYLLGVAPSARASVHSKVTMHRIPFFFAMVTGCFGVESTRASRAKVQVKREPRKLLERFMRRSRLCITARL